MADGISAPEGSATVLWIVPVEFCAHTNGIPTNIRLRARVKILKMDIIVSPFSLILLSLVQEDDSHLTDCCHDR